ncbi:hypothetical protein F4806DRAFT_450606 [Annulohypoxylon nitens]|nr:hypothetical protein F4806DRAFT_450606 [Annulohypoxylon nitens]
MKEYLDSNRVNFLIWRYVVIFFPLRYPRFLHHHQIQNHQNRSRCIFLVLLPLIRYICCCRLLPGLLTKTF